MAALTVVSRQLRRGLWRHNHALEPTAMHDSGSGTHVAAAQRERFGVSKTLTHANESAERSRGRPGVDRRVAHEPPCNDLSHREPAAGVVVESAEDELEVARSAIRSMEWLDPSPSATEPVHPVSDDDNRSVGNEQPVADQFDDFHGRGVWPGTGADDAESDFEDSIGDLEEEGVLREFRLTRAECRRLPGAIRRAVVA